MFKGEDLYSEYLVFKETEQINDAFGFFGIGDKNMVYNSGSYFLIQIGLFVSVFFTFLLNSFARLCAKRHYARKIGMWAYEENYIVTFNQSTVKLFMESYFDLVICTTINLIALLQTKNIKEFKTFFETPSDAICSTLSIIYSFLFIIYPLWGLIKINAN